MAILNKIKDFLFKDEEPQAEKNGNYTKKESLLTNCEMEFYKNLDYMFEGSKKYKLQTQVNLASIVDKNFYSKYRNELFRNIDFGIFDKKTLKPLLMIELNDYTHNYKIRKERDEKVKEILKQSGIPLITFYTNKPNEFDYVFERIENELNKYKKGILTPYLKGTNNK